MIFGQCYPNGEAPAIGRVAALDAGLPIDTPGLQLDRRCGSGLQAVSTPRCGADRGGRRRHRRRSRVDEPGEFYSTDIRWGARGADVTLHDRLSRAGETAGGRNYPVPGGMLETAENLRREYGIPRQEQDEFACARTSAPSPRRPRAGSTRRSSRSTCQGRKSETVVERDEHPRADTTVEMSRRAQAGPAAAGPGGDGDRGQRQRAERRGRRLPRHHAGARPTELGLRPLGRLVSWAVAGVAPAHDGHRPGAGDRQGAAAGPG